MKAYRILFYQLFMSIFMAFVIYYIETVIPKGQRLAVASANLSFSRDVLFQHCLISFCQAKLNATDGNYNTIIAVFQSPDVGERDLLK